MPRIGLVWGWACDTLRAMQSGIIRSARALAAAGTMAFLAPVIFITPMAMAQDAAPPAAGLRPPQPTKEEEPPYILTLLLLALIVGAVIGGNLIPSKRGHQD
jgi:hypothetical protein